MNVDGVWVYLSRTMRQRLLTWQWSLYPAAHCDRRNLLVHIATVPVFMLGTLALLLAWRWPWLGIAGLLAMVLVMAAQGRGHGIEEVAPVPFAGPVDVVTRILAEQWVTFPRFVLSGGFGRAWRAATGTSR
jgi:Protein of unknown function (DUF962)